MEDLIEIEKVIEVIDIVEEDQTPAVSESKIRFGAAAWSKEKHDILVLGAGGIGSWVGLCLARIGHNLIIFDMDTYETVNIAGQFVSNDSIGLPKATSLVNELKRFTDEGKYYGVDLKYDSKSKTLPIVFSCFDNMEARSIAFNLWKKQDNRYLFIDGRLTAESYQVFVCFKGTEDLYEKTLFPDEEAAELPCSYKATTHTAMMIAAEMINCMNQYIAYGDCPNSISYELISFNHKVNEEISWS